LTTKLPSIIDNREENTVLNALKRLLPEVNSLDIATGYFEVGSLLALDGLWQRLKQLRLLMGDETTRRTKQVLLSALLSEVNRSIEEAKERDDSLKGLAAVRQAFQTKQIQARIYARAKFHAKAYLFETDDKQLSDYAIVGSSNFTLPGLTQNLELNMMTTDNLHLQALRQWYFEMWQEGEDVSDEVIRVIEPHLREFSPFEVYAKALYEYFAGKDKPITAWEETDSEMWKILSKYQRDGYRNAVQIAKEWRGALICDGVGLGKTFIGLMILEYHLTRGENVLLIVPKSARESVWQANIERYLKPRYPVLLKKNLDIHNHTDFGRDGTISEADLKYFQEFAHAIIVDEAHHFRNPLRGRGKKLKQLAKGKLVYLLTATPINNSLDDLYHLINYFAQGQRDYFAKLGESNLRGRFLEAERKMEDAIEAGADLQTLAETQDFLRTDTILKAILIQRSRAYVKEAERLEPNAPIFPQREPPQVIRYSLKQVYADIYDDIRKAFDKNEPLINLKIYAPEQFRIGAQDERTKQHENQVIGLIRTLFLKRLESSWKAFEASVEDLLEKMYAFLKSHAPEMAAEWKANHAVQWAIVQQHLIERDLGEEEEEEEDTVDDPETRLDPSLYDLAKLLPLVVADMGQLVSILSQVFQRFYNGETEPQKQLATAITKDDKLQELRRKLETDPLLSKEKVVIFTEFRDTARYLWKALTDVYGLASVDELDSTRKVNRERVIKRFAPYYNCKPEELAEHLADPIRVLISTDVLSEGLNLQDARQIVNYDLHWNPVRLMQRIGRVDRRLNLDAEKQLRRENKKPLKVYVYNFLPPNELDGILRLLQRITGKVLRISKTLGVEAPIGLPDEPQAVLKNFNERYDGAGTKSVEEDLRLELERVAIQHPELYARLKTFPYRTFSGKRNTTSLRGIFCAYRFPPIEPDTTNDTNKQGELRWYFCDSDNGKILEGVESIYSAIRSVPETPRHTAMTWQERNSARKAIETYIRNTHLLAIQAPAGYKPVLVCWMEVSE
jgi:superfamily II DNA or RNA helicase